MIWIGEPITDPAPILIKAGICNMNSHTDLASQEVGCPKRRSKIGEVVETGEGDSSSRCGGNCAGVSGCGVIDCNLVAGCGAG
jgi:hypothetical protein